jgi:hypothetical protein
MHENVNDVKIRAFTRGLGRIIPYGLDLYLNY